MSTLLPFTQAQPDTILLDPAGLVVSDTVRHLFVTALLRRRTGYVSAGILVGFSATKGLFGGSTVSNDSGVVHVQFVPGPVPDTLIDTLRAVVTSRKRDTVYATGAITIVVTP